MKTNRIIMLLLLASLASATAVAQTEQDFSGVPTISYCDLVKEPASYDQKVVRVKAVYVVGFEGSLFYDAVCGGGNTWVKFDPSFEKATKSNILKRFRRLADASPIRTRGGGINYPERMVEILAVGRFEGVKPTYKLGSRSYSSGFGHLNGYDFQFTVLSIEEVNAVPERKSQ
jgi:hypothetical protein